MLNQLTVARLHRDYTNAQLSTHRTRRDTLDTRETRLSRRRRGGWLPLGRKIYLLRLLTTAVVETRASRERGDRQATGHRQRKFHQIQARARHREPCLSHAHTAHPAGHTSSKLEARRLGVARGAWGSAHPCERNFEYARAGPEAAWLDFRRRRRILGVCWRGSCLMLRYVRADWLEPNTPEPMDMRPAVVKGTMAQDC